MTEAARPAGQDGRAGWAVALWRQLGIARAEPASVEFLQDEAVRCVLRLTGAGPDGCAVVAKRCPKRVGLKERSIYLDILPELPFPSICLYGCVEQPDSDDVWLFMEEATGAAYDPGRESHRVLAGHWLGLLHVSASDSRPASQLPRRDPASFVRDLRDARTTLGWIRSSVTLDAADAECVERIREGCRRLQSRWSDLVAFSSLVPPTLIHGDFKEPHIFIRTGPEGPVLLLVDWHECGFGAPALDVAKFLGYSVNPDLAAYMAMMQRRWPQMDRACIRRLAFVGEACRCVASIRWEAERLRYGWIDGPMANLRLFSGWLDDVLRAEPWLEQATLGRRSRVAVPRTWY